MIGATIAIIVIVALEDYRESSRDHTYSDIFPDTGYWSNRWALKYKPDGTKKWWAKYGGPVTAVIDAWHLAKTLGVVIICAHILVAWGITLSWWSLLLAYSVYGGTHELLYNNLYKKRNGSST